MKIKDIPGFEGRYQITENGRIYSLPKTSRFGRNASITRGGIWLRQYPMKRGHMRVYLSDGSRKKPLLTHRLVALAFLPNPDGLPQVNHLDGNPANNHKNNLEWCDASGNAKHAISTGLTKTPDQTGVNNSQSKLNDSSVRKIRQRFNAGQARSKIASDLGLNYYTIRDVVSGKRWAHIK
jgi:hypothetical protein